MFDDIDVAPPIEPPKPVGRVQLHFNVAQFWSDISAPGAFRLRAPVTDPRQLLGPFRGVGGCMTPIGAPGDYRWFDPTLPADDGDMVLCALTPAEMDGIVQRWRARGADAFAQFVETYGERPNRLVVKILKHFGGRLYLVCRESMFALADNKILGVCRFVERDGRALHCAESTQILPGAATETFQTSNVGPVDFTTVPPGAPVADGSVAHVTLTSPVSCDVIMRATYEAELVGTTTGSYSLTAQAFRRETASPTLTLTLATYQTPTTNRTAQTSQSRFSVTALVQYDVGLYASISTPDNVARTLRFRNITVAVELIKR